jgi:hypothetical protein
VNEERDQKFRQSVVVVFVVAFSDYDALKRGHPIFCRKAWNTSQCVSKLVSF